MTDSLICTTDGHKLTITLNRPEALNALDPETMGALKETWQRYDQDDNLRVAILTGAGERAFCAGADLKKTMPSGEPFLSEFFVDPIFALLPPLSLGKPIIGAVNGLALGGGMELALACDVLVAADKAKFGLTEVKVGSMPGAGGTQRLARLLPRGIAKRMLLTGEWLTAEKALHFGLVSEVVPAEELMAAANRVADQILTNAPLSVRAVKLAVDGGQDMTVAQGIQLERLLFGLLRDTEDRIEGRKAFAEKRPPVWKGR